MSNSSYSRKNAMQENFHVVLSKLVQKILNFIYFKNIKLWRQINVSSLIYIRGIGFVYISILVRNFLVRWLELTVITCVTTSFSMYVCVASTRCALSPYIWYDFFPGWGRGETLSIHAVWTHLPLQFVAQVCDRLWLVPATDIAFLWNCGCVPFSNNNFLCRRHMSP